MSSTIRRAVTALGAASIALALGAQSLSCQSQAIGIVYIGDDAGTGGGGTAGSSGDGGDSGNGGSGASSASGGSSGRSGSGGEQDAGPDGDDTDGDADAGPDAEPDVDVPDGDVPDGDVPPTDHCKPASEWAEALVDDELLLFEAINDRRDVGAVCDGTTYDPTPALTMNPILRCSARLHTKDMVDRNYFSLFNPEGEDPQDRMRLAGWQDPRWGENIYHDNDSATAVVALWIAAGGDQCTNIVSSRHDAIGVGRFGNKWTIDLGVSDAGTPAPPGPGNLP